MVSTPRCAGDAARPAPPRGRCLSVVDDVDGPAERRVEPVIRDDAGMTGMPTGENHGVAGPGLVRGMTVLCVGEDGPSVEQRSQAAGVERFEPSQVVVSHLIDGQDQDQPRLRGGGLTRRWRHRKTGGEAEEQKQMPAHQRHCMRGS